MIASLDGADGEFLSAARQAVSGGDGAAALASLGWWDVLPQLADPDLRPAVYSFFRAQGEALCDSPALAGLIAQPYLDQSDLPSGSVAGTVRRRSPRRGDVWVLVGTPTERPLLIDRPGDGAVVVPPEQVQLHPINVPGRLVLHEVELRSTTSEPQVPEARAVQARPRSQFLARVALALEILGASERAVGLAVDYAIDREQFGEPIGRYQAVRHLLAWARTDCVALEHVVHEAVRLDEVAPANYGAVVKALAGRNGRRACERSLQVLGGIGFTAEHEHHHLYSRVLALDALAGSARSLVRELGHALRGEAAHPGFPAVALRPA